MTIGVEDPDLHHPARGHRFEEVRRNGHVLGRRSDAEPDRAELIGEADEGVVEVVGLGAVVRQDPEAGRVGTREGSGGGARGHPGGRPGLSDR